MVRWVGSQRDSRRKEREGERVRWMCGGTGVRREKGMCGWVDGW